MQGRWWLAGLTAVMGLLAIFPVPTLEVVNARQGAVLWRRAARPGIRILLRYVHSSERVPVEGRFRLDSALRLVVEETAFASFGPGLPEIPSGTPYTIRGGMIRVGAGGQALRELSFFVHPFTKHVFVGGGERVALSSQLPEGTLVKVRIRWIPALVALAGHAGRVGVPGLVVAVTATQWWRPSVPAYPGEDRHESL